MIKRKHASFCTVLLAFALLLTSGTQVFAQINESTSPIDTYDIEEDTSSFDDLNEYLTERGQEIIENFNPRLRSEVSIYGINRLTQADSRWGSVIMQTEGSTIASAGCLLTSFTMVRNYLSGVNNTPADVNYSLGNNACPFNWSSAASAYGYTIQCALQNNNGIAASTAYSNIIGAMNEFNAPAIIGVKSGSSTHFVVGYGYTSSGDVLIKDPAGRNYSYLSTYLNSGYIVHRFYIYSTPNP
jgi:predicted double-glycine peptidase